MGMGWYGVYKSVLYGLISYTNFRIHLHINIKRPAVATTEQRKQNSTKIIIANKCFRVCIKNRERARVLKVHTDSSVPLSKIDTLPYQSFVFQHKSPSLKCLLALLESCYRYRKSIFNAFSAQLEILGQNQSFHILYVWK